MKNNNVKDKTYLLSIKDSSLPDHKKKVAGMNESVQGSRLEKLSTHSLNGCIACIIQGRTNNFIEHITARPFLKICNKWKSLYQDLDGGKIIIFISLFNDEGELPENSEMTALLKDYLSPLNVEFQYYNIEDNPTSDYGTLSIIKDKITSNLKMVV